MHRCREQELKLVIHKEDEEESLEDRREMEEKRTDNEEWEMVCRVVELNELRTNGRIYGKTMKLEGELKGVPIPLLIDSGASHNYITRELVTALNLPITETKEYVVSLGDGSKRSSQGKCQGLVVQLGRDSLLLDAYILDLGGMDMILGVEWLESLGEIRADWKKKTMSFELGGKTINLRGYQINENNLTMALQEMLLEREATQEGLTEYQSDLESLQREELQKLLLKYQEVFQEPQGLPPKRNIEHSIELKPGAEPINVRPYKYAYHHKDEIERQVQELLLTGAIKESVSPFSSPVILVKKKDGSWRMCVDYRALNKATVPDKFPIPTISELLDELHSATYFSKIDLKSGFHQIRVKESDTHKTAFRTHEGH